MTDLKRDPAVDYEPLADALAKTLGCSIIDGVPYDADGDCLSDYCAENPYAFYNIWLVLKRVERG